MDASPQMIEILPQISGVKFDDAWQRRIEALIDEQTGLKAFVISAEDFITNKLAAARLQDLADVEAVRKAAEASGPAQKRRPDRPALIGNTSLRKRLLIARKHVQRQEAPTTEERGILKKAWESPANRLRT
jgi:hypothetical protein